MCTLGKISSLVGCAIALAACGSLDIDKLSPTVVAPAAAAAPAAPQVGSIGIGRCVSVDAAAATNASVAAIKSIAASSAVIKSTVPPELANDPVVNSLVAAVARTALQAHRGVMAAQSNRQATEAADTAIAQIGSAGTLKSSDFQTFAKSLSNTALNPVLAPSSNALPAQSKFWSDLINYYDQYFNGKFVDRFGNTLQKPTISTTVSDNDIAGVVAVFVELLVDNVVKTPVWKYSGNYYPGKFTSEPTVLTSGVQSSAAGFVSDPTQCGMTELKAEVVNYLANSASTRASALGGLVTGSFGGFEIGLGVLGKFSVGDNQTLQTIVKTVLGRVAARAAEQASYLVLSEIGYKDGALPADLIAYYLDGSKS
jgi:hypothetical protein